MQRATLVFQLQVAIPHRSNLQFSSQWSACLIDIAFPYYWQANRLGKPKEKLAEAPHGQFAQVHLPIAGKQGKVFSFSSALIVKEVREEFVVCVLMKDNVKVLSRASII